MSSTRKSAPTLLAVALLAMTTAVQAGPRHANETLVRAKVVSTTPIYETVNEPSTRCWTETVGHETQPYPSVNNTGGAVVGAIAGGLLGSAFGKGSGKVASAAVGAATGAVIGDRWYDWRAVSGPRQVERCETTDNFRQIVTGYDVRYRFHGDEYVTRMPYDPGSFVSLQVSFSVTDDPGSNSWKNGYNDWR